MKRIFFITICLIFIALAGVPVYAQGSDPCADSVKNIADQILPCATVSKGLNSDKDGNLLPTANLKTDIVPQAIKILLAVAGSVTAVVFVYAGVMLIISQGNEEELTKFKNVFLWSIIGLVFITASYGLVRGIMQLVFR